MITSFRYKHEYENINVLGLHPHGSYSRDDTHIFICAHSDLHEDELISLLHQQDYTLQIFATRAIAAYKPSTIDLLFTSPTKVELVMVHPTKYLVYAILDNCPEYLI